MTSHEKASEDQIPSHTSPARSIAMTSHAKACMDSEAALQKLTENLTSPARSITMASHEKASKDSEAELQNLTEILTSPARSIAMASHEKASEDSEAELLKLTENLSRLTPSEKRELKPSPKDLQKPESRIKSGSPSPNQLCKSGSASLAAQNQLCKSGSASLAAPNQPCKSGSPSLGAPDQGCKSGTASLAAPNQLQRCKSGSASLGAPDLRFKVGSCASLAAPDQRCKYGSRSSGTPDQRLKSGPTPSVAVPDHIPAHWEEIFKLQKRLSGILHKSHYIDGARVSPEDEAVLRDVLKYHPKCGEKIGPGIDHLKIKKYMYEYTICFWIVRVDGTEIDFSYHKCLKDRRKLPKSVRICFRTTMLSLNRSIGLSHLVLL